MNKGVTRQAGFVRILQLGVILLGSTLIALLIFEGVVRLFFEEPILPRYVIDSGYGVRAHQPNIATRHSVPGDYVVDITTNSSGMRGQREYSIEKPRDVVRVALIGDSFVYGAGVNDHEVVSVVLEDMLNSRYKKANGRRYEVLNFGVAGFGQAEELVTYKEHIRSYRPDIVVLFYFENDIGNNAVAGLYAVSEDGGVERKNQEYLPGVRAREILYGIGPIRWLFEHSQGWNLVRNRLSGIVQNSLLKREGLKTFSDSSDSATRLTRALIDEFIAEIRSDGASPIIAIIPDKDLTSNFPVTGAELKAAGVQLVDGRNYIVSDDYYAHDSHWKPSGHMKAAKALAEVVTSIH